MNGHFTVASGEMVKL